MAQFDFSGVVSDLPDADQQFSGGLEHAGALHCPVIGPL